jgi:hypothetical protein
MPTSAQRHQSKPWCLLGYLGPGITQSSLNIRKPGLLSHSFLSRSVGHAQTACSVRVQAPRLGIIIPAIRGGHQLIGMDAKIPKAWRGPGRLRQMVSCNVFCDVLIVFFFFSGSAQTCLAPSSVIFCSRNTFKVINNIYHPVCGLRRSSPSRMHTSRTLPLKDTWKT